MAALAQNGDGLRADQAGAANDDDLHGYPRLSTSGDPCMGSNASEEKSGPQQACIMQTREAANTEASLLNTPLAVPLTTLSTSNARPTRMRAFGSARRGDGRLTIRQGANSETRAEKRSAFRHPGAAGAADLPRPGKFIQKAQAGPSRSHTTAEGAALFRPTLAVKATRHWLRPLEKTLRLQSDQSFVA